MPGEGLDPVAEQLQRKQRLAAAALRIFGKFGFDEGVAGHITVRDPIDSRDVLGQSLWGRSFKLIRVSDLIRGESRRARSSRVRGSLNGAAFTIHSQIHQSPPGGHGGGPRPLDLRQDLVGARGDLLDPITQDACAFL